MTMECQDQNIPPSFNNVGQNFTFLLKSGYVAIISCFAPIPLPAIAGEYFNPHLLEVNETGTTAVDLSYISQETVPPGEYNLDVYINDEFIASESVSFTQQNEDRDASSPCISVAQLKAWSVKTNNYPELTVAGSRCARLSAIPGWGTTVLLSQQRIDFNVPQVAVMHHPRGYVPESRWQQGINAGLLNYSLSGQKTDPRHGGEATSSQFVYLGFEHVVANFGSFALLYFSPATTAGFTFGNILRQWGLAYLGNYIGGGLLIGLVYAWLNRGADEYVD